MTRFQLAVHRLLRFVLPRRVRQQRGDDMDRTFLHMLEHDERGRTRMWLSELGDLLRTGVRLRSRGSGDRSGGRTPWPFALPAASWLDVKLGLRMLVRHPGLTVVAVFALAVGIPAGLAPWHLVDAAEGPLPVDQAERVVLLRYWNDATQQPAATRLEEVLQWRAELRSFETIGATRRASYRVASGEEPVRQVYGAELTASTFDILRVPPLLGRTLAPADEVPGAANVVLIGHELWRAIFDADPEVVGEQLRIGNELHVVVGVMPEEFLFPVRERLWVPLREQPGDVPFEGQHLDVFGRLADDATIVAAQAELQAVARRTAEAFPDSHARLRGEVVPFSFALFRFPAGGLRSQLGFYVIQLLTLLVLLVACVNVGLLIFARTATRSAELAVRAALGAGRARIVGQMFVESLVLALLAVGVGLLFVDQGLGYLQRFVVNLPYWIDLGVTWETSVRALALALFSAVVAGVVPALRVTGKELQSNMKSGPASWGGLRFGRLSGALIVADVAVAVVIVGLAVAARDHIANLDDSDALGVDAGEYLSAYVQLPGLQPAGDRDFTARVAATQRALLEALAAEPNVRGVAVGSRLPRMDHPGRRVEVEGEVADGQFRGHQVQVARVDVGFFDALGAPVLRGRAFDGRDIGDHRSTVIVNTSFVDDVLGGGEPIGRRLRYLGIGPDAEPGEWLEIIGVVDRLGMNMLLPADDAGLYHAAAPGEIHPVLIGVRLRDDPAAFTPRLRELLAGVDADAALLSPTPLHEVVQDDMESVRAMIWGGQALVVLLVMLAASGTYAIMAFSVAARTHEIGVRTSLGARRRDVVRAVSARSFCQLGIGALIGLPLLWRLLHEVKVDGGWIPHYSPFLLALLAAAGVILLIGVPACLAPTLRALRIAPTEAMRGGA